MNRNPFSSLYLGALPAVLVAALVSAPSLVGQDSGRGAESKQKQERKVKPGETGYTYTNEDLEALSREGVSILGGGASSYTSLPPVSQPNPESWWRQRSQLHFERLDRLNEDLKKMEDRLAKASNPYTRALAGTVMDEEGNERLATPADLKAEVERLRRARASEMEGLGRLREAARNSGVPEQWVGTPEQFEALKGQNASGADQPPLRVDRKSKRTEP